MFSCGKHVRFWIFLIAIHFNGSESTAKDQSLLPRIRVYSPGSESTA